jgi:hypothetical protein
MYFEVDMTEYDPLYTLVSRELLRLLMQRDGRGERLTVRELAEYAEISKSSVGRLLTDGDVKLTHRQAMRTAHRCGVDLLVLWIPAQRSGMSVEMAGAPAVTAVPA